MNSKVADFALHGVFVPGFASLMNEVEKSYVLDYTSPLKNVIMESDLDGDGLVYRYTYGLEKLSVTITGFDDVLVSMSWILWLNTRDILMTQFH